MTIIDLDNSVHREDESAHHWVRQVSTIIHSSDSIATSQAVLVLEKNCKFDPLIHKLGCIKWHVKDMGELMEVVAKYAESCKTKDPDSDDHNSGKEKKNCSKSH